MIANRGQYEFMDRDQPTSNDDEGDDDDHVSAPSRAFTPSVTRVPETLLASISSAETVKGGEAVGGLFV